MALTDPPELRSVVGFAVFLIGLGVLAAGLFLIAPAPARADTVDSVEVTQITKTTARVTVTLSENASANQVYMRIRITTPEGPWPGENKVPVDNGIAHEDIAKLMPGTEYEVEASLDRTFPGPGSVSKKFTTLPPDPSVSGVTVGSITSTGATVTVTIAHPGTASNTVYIRYRTDDSQPWSEPTILQTTGVETVGVTISCFSPGSSYEVEASLEEKFIVGQTVSTSFKMLLPRVSEVNVESKTSSRANIKVTIEDAGPDANTVHLRYGVSSSNTIDWIAAPDASVTGGEASFTLTGLVPGTSYTVQASLDSNFVNGVEASSFTTANLPSIGAVMVGSVEETTASIVVTIFDPDGTEVTVFMRYRETTGGSWSMPLSDGSSSDTLEFTLSELKPDTKYEAEASLTSGFEASLSETFVTEEEVARVSSLTPEKMTRSSAELSMEVKNAQGGGTVFVRYRARTTSNWEPLKRVGTSSGVVRLTLNNLESDTLYEVEASLVSDFIPRETLYATFTTDLGAELRAISIENLTDTSANIVATIDRVEGRTLVYWRYRIYGALEWNSPVSRATTSATASLALIDLLPDTEYEVEASLDSSFPPRKTVWEFFETDPAPAISSLRIRDITDREAKASVNISRPRPHMTVYLRYRAETDQAWNQVISKTVSSRTATLSLEQLVPETRYEVQVSLSAEFQESETDFFTTLEPAPSVSGMEVEDITESSATISLTVSDSPGSVNVYVRYRKTGSSRWTKPAPRTTTTSGISFELNDLTENTSYDIQTSLEPGFPVQSRMQSNFRTRSILRVSEVTLERMIETDALISIRLSGVYETNVATYIRYRELPEGEWIGGRVPLKEADSVVLIPDLSPDTEYEVQVSLDETYGDNVTRVQRFRTPAPEPTAEPTPTPTPGIAVAAVAPQEFSFTMTENALAPQQRRLGIWSSGPMAGMEVSISEDVEWLYLNPTSGMSMSREDIIVVELTIDASGLGVGTYSGELELDGNAENLPLRIPVTLIINAATPKQAPTSTPEATPNPTKAPSPVPLASPSAVPSPEPTETTISTPTTVPAPAETSPAKATPETTSFSMPTATPFSLPTSTPTSPAPARSETGSLAVTVFLIVSAAAFLIVVGFYVGRRSIRP